MIRLENVTIGYEEHVVIDKLSLNISENQITTIIGANGCGKSTLLKAMTKYLKPFSGEISLAGMDIYKMKASELSKKMAVLPQTRSIPGDIKVKDLVSYGRFPYMRFGRRLSQKDYDIVDWALDKTGLCSLRNRKVSTLSGGEQQRAWIAMTVAQKTDILLLDEPTTFLDISYQIDVLELIKDLNNQLNLTIVMVLHDINHAARYSHQLIALKDGNVHTFDTTCKAMNQQLLEDVFDIEARLFNDDVNQCVYFIPQKVKRRRI